MRNTTISAQIVPTEEYTMANVTNDDLNIGRESSIGLAKDKMRQQPPLEVHRGAMAKQRNKMADFNARRKTKKDRLNRGIRFHDLCDAEEDLSPEEDVYEEENVGEH